MLPTLPSTKPSTAIANIAYDGTDHRLIVTFVTGRIYEYFDVPAGIAASFRRAASRGGFFNRHIRDHYDFHEITGRRFSVA
ncbi:MAG TPA: KTSC domain-containing protein [Pseudolabrys sp.]|nr:KTSC domain-containing protein [Pseudolabrys sp.]